MRRIAERVVNAIKDYLLTGSKVCFYVDNLATGGHHMATNVIDKSGETSYWQMHPRCCSHIALLNWIVSS